MARLARILSDRITPLTSARVLKCADYARLEKGESVLRELAREQQRAKQDSARTFEENKQRGYEEGLAKSEETRATQAFETVARAISYFESMEDDMVDLLESALDKIADGLDKDKLVRQVIARALRDYRSLPQITIHIARSQEKALHKDIERLAQAERLAGLVKVAVNSRLEEGACLLESPLGTVELGISSQIASLKAALATLRSSPQQKGIEQKKIEHERQSSTTAITSSTAVAPPRQNSSRQVVAVQDSNDVSSSLDVSEPSS